MKALSIGLRLKEGATAADHAAVADGLQAWRSAPPIPGGVLTFLPDAESIILGIRNGKQYGAFKIEAPDLSEAAICAALRQTEWCACLEDSVDMHGFDWSISE